MRTYSTRMQHLNATCRAAREFPSLCTSRLLLSLNDRDFVQRRSHRVEGAANSMSWSRIGLIIRTGILTGFDFTFALPLSILPDWLHKIVVGLAATAAIQFAIVSIGYSDPTVAVVVAAILLLVVVVILVIGGFKALRYSEKRRAMEGDGSRDNVMKAGGATNTAAVVPVGDDGSVSKDAEKTTKIYAGRRKHKNRASHALILPSGESVVVGDLMSVEVTSVDDDERMMLPQPLVLSQVKEIQNPLKEEVPHSSTMGTSARPLPDRRRESLLGAEESKENRMIGGRLPRMEGPGARARRSMEAERLADMGRTPDMDPNVRTPREIVSANPFETSFTLEDVFAAVSIEMDQDLVAYQESQRRRTPGTLTRRNVVRSEPSYPMWK